MSKSLLNTWRIKMKTNERFDASLYNISVRKGDFDGEVLFEARIKELPDVAEYADSYEEAYSLAIDTLETTAEVFLEQGKVMPLPIIDEADYSGRVTLRMPKSLHAAYASWSESEEISLNQLVVNCLSFSLGQQFGRNHTLRLLKSTMGSQHRTDFIPVDVKKKPVIKLVGQKKSISLYGETEKQVAYG